MHTLQPYQKMRRPTEKIIKNLAEKIFLGIYMRSYDRISREFADSFGLSASTVSRAFKDYSQQVLEELEARDLSEETYVALLFDATNILDKHILICTGITAEGTKVILGFIEPVYYS